MTDVFIDDLLEAAAGRELDPAEKSRIVAEVQWRMEAAKLGIDPYVGVGLVVESASEPTTAQPMHVGSMAVYGSLADTQN